MKSEASLAYFSLQSTEAFFSSGFVGVNSGFRQTWTFRSPHERLMVQRSVEHDDDVAVCLKGLLQLVVQIAVFALRL